MADVGTAFALMLLSVDMVMRCRAPLLSRGSGNGRQVRSAGYGTGGKPAKANSGYTVTREGERVTFTYDKAKHGVGAGCGFAFLGIAFGAVIGVMTYLIASPGSGARWDRAAADSAQTLAWAVFWGIAIGVGIVLPLILNGRRGGSGSFAVEPDHIEVDGERFERASIRRIVIPDGPELNVSGGHTTMVGYGLQGQMTAMTHNAMNLLDVATTGSMAAIQKSGSGIRFTYGEKDHWLVRHVRRPRAEAIFFELGKVLDRG